MRLFINSLSASAGGGLTYIRNVIPHLQAQNNWQTTIALSSSLRKEFGEAPNLDFLELQVPPGRRFLYEQTTLPKLIRGSQSDVLLSVGNFSLWKSPVPQILLSRNSLYTSSDFFADLRSRGDYRAWIETRLKAVLAKWSISVADCVVAPSQAFAEELGRWTGRSIQAIHHGFDPRAFARDESLLTDELGQKLESGGDALKLLFVSHYNYYRNFETLIRALPLLKQQLGRHSVRLFLTCKLARGENPGAYSADSAALLVRELGLTENIIELGAIPYQLLHQVYRAADIYVTPSYAETFAHPLVEAMSSHLPVVASDLPVHREICGSAALYFSRFSPPELAECILRIARSPELAKQLAEAGSLRATEFSWREHVNQILTLARDLATRAAA
jgi:glycosyltransferase involved in cell wall biosynthesis